MKCRSSQASNSGVNLEENKYGPEDMSEAIREMEGMKLDFALA